jgi:hypothetical protein
MFVCVFIYVTCTHILRFILILYYAEWFWCNFILNFYYFLRCMCLISNFIRGCIKKYIISLLWSPYECSRLVIRPVFNSLIYSNVDINICGFLGNLIEDCWLFSDRPSSSSGRASFIAADAWFQWLWSILSLLSALCSVPIQDYFETQCTKFIELVS